jgi:hypothetical protein
VTLNDLLRAKGFDPSTVLVLRHRPHEPELRKVLPWLAAERPEVFNAYQSTQTERVEQSIKQARYFASCIGQDAGRATFVGLYQIGKAKPLTRNDFWRIPAHVELKQFGMKGFAEDSPRKNNAVVRPRGHEFLSRVERQTHRSVGPHRRGRGGDEPTRTTWR